MSGPSSFTRPFRFRLNCIDYYQCPPTHLDPALPPPTTSTQVKEYADVTVPIIRIFGATEAGQKVCAHIHGAFPYLYLEYNGSLDQQEVNSYIRILTASINHAFSLSFRRNPFQGAQTSYVAHISLAKGIPFYGYHVGYRNFLKVYLRNPNHMTRFADLLTQGAILARSLQPYETHLQFLLQWMCDYNLYGCGFVDCEKVTFRSPIPSAEETFGIKNPWNERTILQNWILNPIDFPRQSHCAIEVDVRIEDILNRREIQARDIHKDFSERFFNYGQDYKFVQSMAGLWRDESVRRKNRMGLNDSDVTPFPPEALITMSADPRLGRGNWIHEEEHFEALANIVEKERPLIPQNRLGFDTYVVPNAEQAKVETAFESVQDFFPQNLNRILQSQGVNLEDPAAIASQVVVDEDSIIQITDCDYKSSSLDEETEKNIYPDVPALKLETGNEPKMELSPNSRKEAIRHEPDILRNGTSPKKRKLHHTEVLRNRDNKVYEMQDSLSINGSKGQSDSIEAVISLGKEPSCTSSASKTNTKIRVNLDQPSGSQRSISSPASQSSIKSSFPTVKNVPGRDSAAKLKADDGLLEESSIPSKSTDRDRIEVPHGSRNEAKSNHPDNTFAISPRAKICASRLFKMSSPKQYLFGFLPPSRKKIEDTLAHRDRPSVIQQDAYYSDELDVPKQPQEFFTKEFKLQSLSVPYLADFDSKALSLASFGEKPPIVVDHAKQNIEFTRQRKECTYRTWQLAKPPPPPKAVKKWVKQMQLQKRQSEALKSNKLRQKRHTTQLDGPTMKPAAVPGHTAQVKTSVRHETQYMTMMSVEVHVDTRKDFVPDPAQDAIKCIFWCTRLDLDDEDVSAFSKGILVLSSQSINEHTLGKWTGASIYYAEDELELLNCFIDLVRDLDPDILVGYEVHNGSWGYLIERARIRFEFDLCVDLSRVRSLSNSRAGKDIDRWGFTQNSAIRITGRHMINVWRAVRGELNLLQYTMENVVFKVLRRRIPHFSFEQLTEWYQSRVTRNWAKVMNYFLSRVQLNLRILEGLDVVARTSEQARLLGVDWFSVITRGSQFKVESLIFRIAKPENYILPSPSRKQVGQQNALECLPLVMEPQSNFYPSPVLVLDFQSLYPSVMIAYNYCYSTCLGRIADWRGGNKMGFTNLERETGILGLLQKHVNISPNGLIYVRPEIRRSLLAKMLTEILETRVMVKSGMKQDRDDKVLQRLLNNRQLALKLIANVTYGYASASFSGRMPCAEIADSIVQTARETLEKTIAVIHSVKRWDAEVVYGDTDSIFVHLKNRSRAEAFEIGKEIADTITKSNPRPVKLKFEKVYHPCVLLAKKRYVGFKYESPDQTVPEFDAKGIETVRRDGTPAEQKIEEQALKILFRTHDLSKVKRYFQDQCIKIMLGNVSIQDFLFAREVKLGHYSENGILPAGAMIATKNMLQDHRREPQYGERVPYLVIAGAAGARLIDRCVDPSVLLKDDQKELDSEYYIGKNIIPPLERIFNLVGANVRAWYDEIPKVHRLRSTKNVDPALAKAMERNDLNETIKRTLETYLKDKICIICREPLTVSDQDENTQTGRDTANKNNKVEKISESDRSTSDDDDDDEEHVIHVCHECNENSADSLFRLHTQLQSLEERVSATNAICRSCSGVPFIDEVTCDSGDCPVYYARVRYHSRLSTLKQKARVILGESNDEL
jgi:DNA polymerase zeta